MSIEDPHWFYNSPKEAINATYLNFDLFTLYATSRRDNYDTTYKIVYISETVELSTYVR